MNNNRVFWKSSLILLLMGLVGLLSVLPTLRPMLSKLQDLPGAPELPDGPLLLLSLINPLILILISILIGNRLAPQLGLTSHVVESVRTKKSFLQSIKPHVLPSLIVGSLLGIVIFLLDFIFRPGIPEALHFTKEQRTLAFTISGMFYGGIVEELFVRWGIMTLIIWLGWRFVQKRQGTPKQGTIWFSNALTSLLFAAGHLGAIALEATLTPIVLTRTILLNGLVGIVFGWMFWKKGLESAMIAHAFFHIAITLVVHLVP